MCAGVDHVDTNSDGGDEDGNSGGVARKAEAEKEGEQGAVSAGLRHGRIEIFFDIAIGQAAKRGELRSTEHRQALIAGAGAGTQERQGEPEGTGSKTGAASEGGGSASAQA
eukprot:g7116.t1